MVVSDPLRPNADVLNTWIQGDFDSVNDAVTQPNAGDSDYLSGTDADNNEVYKCGFPNTIDDVDEVTNITVWSYGYKVGGENGPEMSVKLDEWLEETWQNCALPEGAGNDDWTSDSFNGSWTQEELDRLEVWIRADTPEKFNMDMFDVIYVIVTYTVAAAGWGHKINGVANANIGKINGVLKANIGKVNGV